MNLFGSFLCVAVGGALGASSRYAVSLLMMGIGGRFPYATLVVNLSGALMAGFLVTVLTSRPQTGSVAHLLIVVGFFGSFTTLSAFSVDTLRLLQSGAIFQAVLNVTWTMLGCLFAVYVGARLASLGYSLG